MRIRDEIVRGFFHRINRILSRKNQIFDIDTIFYSPYYVKKKFKKPDLLGLWKNPLTIPCLAGTHRVTFVVCRHLGIGYIVPLTATHEVPFPLTA